MVNIIPKITRFVNPHLGAAVLLETASSEGKLSAYILREDACQYNEPGFQNCFQFFFGFTFFIFSDCFLGLTKGLFNWSCLVFQTNCKHVLLDLSEYN